MPANIAHMVIVHQAFERLRTRGFDELAAFARMIAAAAEEYDEYGGDSPMYREYIAAPGYIAYYDQAVQ